MEQNNEQHALATYVSDMLALERHVRIPFDTQKNDGDFAKVAGAAALVSRLSAASDDHVKQLKECLDELGGHEASAIKSAVSQIEGFVAGAIDKTRKTKVSKSLRDDYTALALCAAGYTALIATANAMGARSVASTAEALLKDYAGFIMEIGRALPKAVVEELSEIGLDVDASTASSSVVQVERAWETQSHQQFPSPTPARVSIGFTDSAFADTTLANN
jgi:ferritin-like metal-binding protein YciE